MSIASCSEYKPFRISGQYTRPKNAAALYCSISSGMLDHLLPFLVDHPSTVAISNVTVAPRITSPVARSVAYAVQALRSLLNSNLSVVNLRLELMAAIINWLLQLGLPWIICRFCITINGAMFNLVEISNAIKQLATLPRKASGTRSELDNALLDALG
jgi:hypothetical protein